MIINKRRSNRSSLWLFFFLIVGCNIEQEGGALLTLVVEPGCDWFASPPSPGQGWLLLSDGEGELIEIRRVVGGEMLFTFQGTPSGSLTLTFLTFNTFPLGNSPSALKQYSIVSFQGLRPGQRFDLKQAEPRVTTPIPEVLAEIPFTIRGYSDSRNILESFDFSDGYECCFTTLNYSSLNYQPPVLTGSFRLRDNPGKILISSYREGKPVHKWLSDVTPSRVVDIDFSSFEESKTIPLNRAVAMGGVRSVMTPSFKGDISKGMVLSTIRNRFASQSSHSQSVFSLGYVDGFDLYLVYARDNFFPTGGTGNSVGYWKLGALPPAIHLPDNSFRLLNPIMANFRYQFTNDYTTKSLVFSKREDPSVYVDWHVRGPAGLETKIPRLPGFLLAQHPDLNPDVLQLRFARFTHHLDGYSYVNELEDYFGRSFSDRSEFIYYEFRNW